MGEGLPFITNYPPSVYQQGPQNFAVIQDQQGFLYFGNTNGVIRYDGHRWELYQVTNKSEVHSLAVDPNGRVYVGGQGDFGYLDNDPVTGHLHYVSMLPLLPDSLRNFNDVWNIYADGSKVIFRSTAGIYVFRDGRIKAISFPNTTHRSFFVYGELFVREDGYGLRKMVNDSLVAIPGGNRFSEEPIHSMLPYEVDKYLVVSQNKGMFIYDGKKFIPFSTQIDELIQGQSAYGEQLADGTYAFGTRRGGLMILDQEGIMKYHLTISEGLINESVWAVCEDRFSGNLWVATNNGISFVELGSPFTIFKKQSGLSGQVYDLAASNNILYATTSLGVFSKPLDKKAHQFTLVKELESTSWHFYKDGNTLLVASNRGIFSINGNDVKNIGFTDRAWFFLPLRHRPGYILVNTVVGFVMLKKVKNDFVIHSIIPRFYESMYYFCEDEKGNIWADSPIKGMYKMQLNDDATSLTYQLYNSQNGFPTDFKNVVFQMRDQVRFGTDKGIYRYDEATDSIMFDDKLNYQIFQDERPVVEHMEQDPYGTFWFVAGKNQGVNYYACGGYAAETGDEVYERNRNVFMRVRDFKLRSFFSLDGDHIYIATSDGVLHFSPTKIKNNRFPVVLRKLQFMKNDSTVNILRATNRLTITHHYNNLRFEFASMQFGANAIDYQTYLQGFDEHWQAYSPLSMKEYTQLPSGNYVFRLRAKNLYNQVSEELAFPFRIVTPWYNTSFAYGCYIVIAVLLVYNVARWRSRQLEIKNQRLEALVVERTTQIQKQHDDIMEKNRLLGNQKEEIESQKEDIERANAELIAAKNIIGEQYEELRHVNHNLEKIVSDRTSELQNAYQNLLETKNELNTFIYRSSHDIKGPLLRLLGLCNVALMDVRDDKAYDYFKKLENEIKSTNRILQKLIVFHYVKNAEVSMRLINIKETIVRVIGTLKSLDGFDKVDFQIEESLNREIQSDSYLLEAALYNVLENAVVFRRNENSWVKISAALVGENYELTISDNGKGISREASDKIFNMFYRGSEYSSGAGLGLYITTEALKKINGSISYETQEPTTFKVTVPAAVLADFVCEYS
ncbi:MAG TPA: ATP-binding protein [Chryseosolibacter sp.]|nr:ATP-binding protein [Chryseosolibacter sp.]